MTRRVGWLVWLWCGSGVALVWRATPGVVVWLVWLVWLPL
jgi:hypothetical protein